MSNKQDLQQIIDAVIAARQASQGIAPALNKVNLTLAEWVMLDAIKRSGQSGSTMSELSAALKISLPMVTAQHKRLQSKGFVTAHTSNTDRRSRVTTCTDKGRDTLETILATYRNISE
jgi:DNA-binding MarR family transcriptional regulator